MIKLEAENVLLKPSHRKQVMAWLRRAMKLGQRLGDFVMTVTLRRSGKSVEATAIVHDSAGDFGLKTREHDCATPCATSCGCCRRDWPCSV